jgi:hypothetical protein
VINATHGKNDEALWVAAHPLLKMWLTGCRTTRQAEEPVGQEESHGAAHRLGS